MTLIPIILSSNKTTHLGHNRSKWLLAFIYISIGYIHNNVQHPHHNGVLLLRFLTNPKSTKPCPPLYYVTWIDWLLNVASKEHSDDPNLWKFHHQLFHMSLGRILIPLKAFIEIPDVTQFLDGYYHCVIYSISPYIANYPEQALLTCIMQGWCNKWVIWLLHHPLLNVDYCQMYCFPKRLIWRGQYTTMQRTHHNACSGICIRGSLGHMVLLVISLWVFLYLYL